MTAWQTVARRLASPGGWLASLLSLTLPLAQAQVPADPYNYSRTSSFTYRADGLLDTETVEPDSPNVCVVTQNAYDDYGNKRAATTSNCTGASGRAVFAARGASSDYTVPQTVTVSGVSVTLPRGAFPITSANALNQSETKEYDPRFGAVTKLTGPNALATRFEYDDFSRKTKTIAADGTSTVTYYCYLASSGLDTSSNTPGCPSPGASEIPWQAVSFVHTEPRDTSGVKSGPFVRVYSDGLGREVRSVTEGFDGASQPAALRGALIVQDTQYNNYGARILSTQPYFLSTGSSTTTGANDFGVSRTDYDVLGRVTAAYTADPHGNQGNTAFGSFGIRNAAATRFSYTGLNTTVTNDKGQIKVEEKTIEGKIARITDNLGAQLAHQYDAFGNLVQTKDALQNTLTVKYDVRGRKVEMTDPDTGLWQYDYNALGELVWQQSANQRAVSQQTTMSYDVLGRMTQRVDPEYTSTWTYDKYADNSACAKGIGKLCELRTSHGITRKMVYDALGRPSSARVDVSGGISAATKLTYSASTGRVATTTYPTGVSVSYGYTALGAMSQLLLVPSATINALPSSPGGTGSTGSLAANSMLWEARTVSAWGKVEKQAYGNNVITSAAYEALTGRTTALTAGQGAATNVLDQGYVWDSLSALQSRSDANGDGNTGAVSETFGYDGLNRLNTYTVAAPAIPNLARTVTLQYNALGSVLYKSDTGAYTYNASGPGAVRPHALASVVGSTVNGSYTYDANGNLVSSTASKYSAIAYNSFNLPDSQTGVRGSSGGGTQYTWQYDENHARLKEVRTIASGTYAGTRTTWYLHPDNTGGLSFEREENVPASASASNPAVASNRHYLNAGGAVIGVLVTTGALPPLSAGQTAPAEVSTVTIVKLEYWHKDHLGSLAATTDQAGNVTARYAYDPFGKRRQTNGTYDAFGTLVVDWSPAVNYGTDRGFTGHEHLDDVGLIHMNGRIFDPVLGMFLQGDPFIQDPENLQNYNRFQYCYNNPLTCTDPSGYFNLHKALFGGIEAALDPRPKHSLQKLMDHIHAQPFQSRVDHYIVTHSWANSLGQTVATYFTAFCGGCGGYAWAMYYTYQATGSVTAGMRAAAIAYVTSVAFDAVGTGTGGHNIGTDYFGTSEHLANIAGHALVGCASAAISGGDCKSQALASAFQSFAAPIAPKGGTGLAVAMVVGGTASKLGGGKFANGALTAAMGYIYNQTNIFDEFKAARPASGIDYLKKIWDAVLPPREPVVADSVTFAANGRVISGAVTLTRDEDLLLAPGVGKNLPYTSNSGLSLTWQFLDNGMSMGPEQRLSTLQGMSSGGMACYYVCVGRTWAPGNPPIGAWSIGVGTPGVSLGTSAAFHVGNLNSDPKP